MIDSGRAAKDDGSAHVAYFRAVGGIELGRDGSVDPVEISAGGAEPVDKAEARQRPSAPAYGIMGLASLCRRCGRMKAFAASAKCPPRFVRLTYADR